jgi:cysteine-rich repeat protein
MKGSHQMKNLLSIIGLCLGLATSLSACELYLGEHRGGREPRDGGDWVECRNDGAYRCNLDGCYWFSSTCPDQPNYECKTSEDCAAGCYCAADGTCVEAGFCASDADCGPGYTCNEQRSACEPNTNGCTSDADCAMGTVCNLSNNKCEAKPQPACGDGVVNEGEICDDGNTTAGDGCSADCKSNEACGNGIVDAVTGEQCDDGNRANGDTCSSTCKTSGPISCAGAITCNRTPPVCTRDSVPLIQDGCYTGTCKLVTECDAPPVCAALRLEANCTTRPDCEAIYNGINCRRPDGTACRAGDASCVCESFRFASCEAAGN